MLLEKSKIKDVCKGDFCQTIYESKEAMINSGDYKSHGNPNDLGYNKSSHLADMDIMYVTADNVFDQKSLIKVIPVSCDNYNIKRDLINQLNKGKYYLVQRASVRLIVDRAIINSAKEDYSVNKAIRKGFNDIPWEGN